MQAASVLSAAASSEKVSDGTRTRDRLDHNQELYLLSYAHHAVGGLTPAGLRNLACQGCSEAVARSVAAS